MMNCKLNDNINYDKKELIIANNNYKHDNKDNSSCILSSIHNDILKYKKSIIFSVLFIFIMSFLISFSCTSYMKILAEEGIQKRKTEDRIRDINDYRAAHDLPLINIK